MSLILTYNCHSDSATLSGGDWSGTLPLGNLQVEDLGQVARSTDAALASTQFALDLGTEKTLKTFLAGPTNLQATYQHRIRAYEDAGLTTLTHDSGWVQPMGGVPLGELDWLEPHFWLGVATHDDPRRGLWVIHVFETPVRARYWTLELDDTANADGFLQIGRLFLGDYWVPSTGYKPGGNGIGFRDASLSSTSLSGAKHFWRRTNPRFFRFGFDHLPEAEAFKRGLRFWRVSGFDAQMHVIADPDDTQNIQLRSMLGRIRQGDALEQVVWALGAMGFEIEEVI